MFDKIKRFFGESDDDHDPREVLYACGYCDAPVTEDKEGGDHPHFGPLCQDCDIPSLHETWTADGKVVGMDICPNCSSKLTSDISTFDSDPFAGTIDEGLYGGVMYRSCPNCNFSKQNLM